MEACGNSESTVNVIIHGRSENISALVNEPDKIFGIIDQNMTDWAAYLVIWGIALLMMISMGFLISSLRVEKRTECDNSHSRLVNTAIVISTILATGYAISITAIVKFKCTAADAGA